MTFEPADLIKRDFRILDFQPVSAGDGDAISFTYKGTRFVYEIWSTDQAGGRDYYAYDDSGKELTGTAFQEVLWSEDDSAIVDEFLNEVYDLWLENKEKYVHPAWERAVHDTLVTTWDAIQQNDPGEE